MGGGGEQADLKSPHPLKETLFLCKMAEADSVELEGVSIVKYPALPHSVNTISDAVPHCYSSHTSIPISCLLA